MKYWALKTWEDKDDDRVYTEDKDRWKDFLKNNVIAIGWGKIDITSKADKKAICDALKKSPYKRYNTKKPYRAASTIYNFLQLTKDDNILICRGYSWNSGDKVSLYGTAKVTGAFCKGNIDDWSCFIRKAKIIDFNKKDGKEIPKKDLIGMLDGRKSFVGTLLKLSPAQYNRIVEWLRH